MVRCTTLLWRFHSLRFSEHKDGQCLTMHVHDLVIYNIMNANIPTLLCTYIIPSMGRLFLIPYTFYVQGHLEIPIFKERM